MRASERFELNIDDEPEDERPRPMTAARWRQALDEDFDGFESDEHPTERQWTTKLDYSVEKVRDFQLGDAVIVAGLQPGIVTRIDPKRQSTWGGGIEPYQVKLEIHDQPPWFLRQDLQFAEKPA